MYEKIRRVPRLAVREPYTDVTTINAQNNRPKGKYRILFLTHYERENEVPTSKMVPQKTGSFLKTWENIYPIR